jgi:tetratricopeptide (TPR) repeat protein
MKLFNHPTKLPRGRKTMSFLKKMFGKQDPVEEMRQLHTRQDWAGVLSAAKKVDRDNLGDGLLEEIVAWENQAGDALAAINLDEGQWAQKSGNLLRAREDFQLAIELARSTELRQRAEQALAALDRGEPPTEEVSDDDGPAIHTGCDSGCSTTTGPTVTPEESDLDEEARMELLLATLPEELAERYMNAGKEFRMAWLAAQDGEDRQALELLSQVPEAERNSLFLYERGALMARGGQHQRAYQDLQAALTIEPGLFHAFETLADVMAASDRIDELEKILKQSLAAERFVGYCWGRLAELHAHRGELEPALAAGLKSLDEGIIDPNLIILCARLLENLERFDEAEALLMKMPGGGCGGGAHPMLAEFWLRRGENFDQALESFKGALRQERDNPRWLLRISQVYLAKGWRKEAAEQIERLMHQGNLPEPILAEVKSVADQLKLS